MFKLSNWYYHTTNLRIKIFRDFSLILSSHALHVQHADLEISKGQLALFLDQYEETPWKVIART